MQLHKFRLKFVSPLHISARGVQFEQVSQIIHSDTLFGAIVNAWSLLYPEDIDDAFFAQGNSSPPFLLSSAFPYFENWEFFPRPLSLALPRDRSEGGKPDLRKKIKRMQFVESLIFFEYLQGRDLQAYHPDQTLGDGKFWLGTNPPANNDHYILRQEEMPRVVIDRYTNSGNHYFVSELYFEEGGGLFFLAQFLKQDWQNKFEVVLRLLGDEGLGLDRSSGKGMFEIEKSEPFVLPQPSMATCFMTLSLFHPTLKDVSSPLLDTASYELVHRAGWITTPGRGTPYRRQRLTMFAEGSVFNGPPEQIYGNMPSVLKETFVAKDLQHNVYRYGFAFPVGMAQGEAKWKN